MTPTSAVRRLPWFVAAISLAALAFAGVAGLTAPASLDIARFSVSDAGWWVAYVTFIVVGAIVSSRRPDNVVGWLMLGAGAFNAFAQVTLQYAAWGLVRHPGSLPGGSFAAWMSTFVWAPATAATVAIAIYFPTGSLVSRRWRWLPVALGGATLVICVATAVDLWSLRGLRLIDNMDALAKHRVSGRVIALGWPLVLGCVIAAMVSIVVRYRRARGVERHQLKWLMVAAIVTAPMIIGGEVTQRWPTLNTAFLVLNSPAWFAIAIALAILRYRLYDIDRIVSRTVTYAVLTALLVGLYVGVVAFATHLLPSSSSFAVAVSTLLVAAVFQPLRRRLQAAVDRRFNRAGYDAARTVEAFSTRLRSGVDMNLVTADLLGVVGHTVQPATLSLWVVS